MRYREKITQRKKNTVNISNPPYNNENAGKRNTYEDDMRTS